MIVVSINNEQQQFEKTVTVDELLGLCGYECKKVAVAINTEFVPRSGYDSQMIADGDAIDILAAVQGG